MEWLKMAIYDYLKKSGKECTYSELCAHFVDDPEDSQVTMSDVLECIFSLKKEGRIQSKDMPTKYWVKI